MTEPTKKTGPARRVRVDAKGRVLLPKERIKNVSSFEVTFEHDGRIVLSPLVEIPLREHWLHANPIAKGQVSRGLEQMGRGELADLGSFAVYADDDED